MNILSIFTGLPVKDYVYGGIIAALLIGFGVFIHHERAIGASHELVAVKAASAKVEATAEAKIKSQTDQYTAQHAQEVTTYETQLKTARAERNTDQSRLQRLLDSQASSCSGSSVLRSASGGSAPQGAVQPGAPESKSLAGTVGGDAIGLADAVRALDASLSACEADRDSLTGK